MTEATTTQFSTRYRWLILIILTLIYGISLVDRQIVSILVEPIKAELEVSDTQMGYLSGLVFALFYATLGLPIAKLADRSNRKTIIAISLAIFSGMTALCGTATSYLQLALFRMGVGIGEAGTSPPSHSIISDLFPPEKRSGAMAVFSLGVPIGILIGFTVGGYVAANYGWRSAFYVVGIPGIMLAVLSFLFLREPPRGMADGFSGETEKTDIRGVFVLMLRRKTALHLVLGAMITSFVSYGLGAWAAAFLIRSFNVDIAFAGLALGITLSTGGALGAFVGGVFSNILRKRDVRWPCWLICITTAIAIPLGMIAYTASNVYVALVFLCFPAAMGSLYFGPTIAMLHGVVPLSARATASAIMFLILNLAGLGFGPTAVGFVSDSLSLTLGQESLRYALLTIAFIQIWAILHFYMASRYLIADTEAVNSTARMFS